MNPVVKGALQGAIPTLVLVGGTNLIVKKFRDSKPVFYWGSLAVATGVAIAVVQGRIPAPFMKAETLREEYERHWGEIDDEGAKGLIRCAGCDEVTSYYDEMNFCDACQERKKEGLIDDEGNWTDEFPKPKYAETFGAYDYEDDEKHFRISRKGDGETIAIIDVEVDGEYSHLNDALDAICDEPNRNVEQIIYGAESFNADLFHRMSMDMPEEMYSSLHDYKKGERYNVHFDSGKIVRVDDEYYIVIKAKEQMGIKNVYYKNFDFTLGPYPYTAKGWFNGYMKWKNVPMRGRDWATEVQEALGDFTDGYRPTAWNKGKGAESFESDSNNCFICSKPATRERGFTNQHGYDGEGTSPRITDERGSVWFCKEHDNLYDFGLFSTGNLLAWTHPNGTKYVQGR